MKIDKDIQNWALGGLYSGCPFFFLHYNFFYCDTFFHGNVQLIGQLTLCVSKVTTYLWSVLYRFCGFTLVAPYFCWSLSSRGRLLQKPMDVDHNLLGAGVRVQG